MNIGRTEKILNKKIWTNEAKNFTYCLQGIFELARKISAESYVVPRGKK